MLRFWKFWVEARRKVGVIELRFCWKGFKAFWPFERWEFGMACLGNGAGILEFQALKVKRLYSGIAVLWGSNRKEFLRRGQQKASNLKTPMCSETLTPSTIFQPLPSQVTHNLLMPISKPSQITNSIPKIHILKSKTSTYPKPNSQWPCHKTPICKHT